jgi:uncharacterized protein (TIGR03032 family)
MDIQFTADKSFTNLLYTLNKSLVVTADRLNELVFIKPQTPDELTSYTHESIRTKSIAIKESHFAIATDAHFDIYKTARKTDTDIFYQLKSSHTTGDLDIHGMSWKTGKLYFINTLYSALCTLDPMEPNNFVKVWHPAYINKTSGTDQTHLNGFAIDDGVVKYVTALGKSNKGAWKKKIKTGGIVIDAKKNKIITTGLSMPHSPRIYNDKLYILESAAGKMIEIDRETGKKHERINFGSFIRGMCLIDDYIFVGISKIRSGKGGSLFDKLQVDESTSFAGIAAIKLSTLETIGQLKFSSGVTDIYNIKKLPNKHIHFEL